MGPGDWGLGCGPSLTLRAVMECRTAVEDVRWIAVFLACRQGVRVQGLLATDVHG
jgi:hypothetical protein